MDDVSRWWAALSSSDRESLRIGRPRLMARFVEVDPEDDAHAPYYDADDAVLEDPARFAFIGDLIPSPFFTADVARLRSGGHTVIEINDGGCSNFPEQLDPRDVFRAFTGARRRRRCR